MPGFFVPEHGTMFTIALVRFPPTATKEIQYLNAKGALTYTDIAGDPVFYGSIRRHTISLYDWIPYVDSSNLLRARRDRGRAARPRSRRARRRCRSPPIAPS